GFLTARQAAAALEVTLPTLYAYASRGQLRSEPTPGRPRERRYYRDDIVRLRERKEMRGDPAKAAARGLHWGSPGLSSAITLIQSGRLYYRGQDTLMLAEQATLENVATLLWAADSPEQEQFFQQACPLSTRQLTTLRRFAKDSLSGFQVALPLAGRI